MTLAIKIALCVMVYLVVHLVAELRASWRRRRPPLPAVAAGMTYDMSAAFASIVRVYRVEARSVETGRPNVIRYVCQVPFLDIAHGRLEAIVLERCGPGDYVARHATGESFAFTVEPPDAPSGPVCMNCRAPIDVTKEDLDAKRTLFVCDACSSPHPRSRPDA